MVLVFQGSDFPFNAFAVNQEKRIDKIRHGKVGFPDKIANSGIFSESGR